MQAQIWEVSHVDYHADHGKIGASMLRIAIKSLTKYRRMFIDDPPLVEEPTPDMILGSAVHCLVLEPDRFQSLFCVRPEGIDGRTTDGKKKLAEWRLASIDKQELTSEQHEKAKAIANSVLTEPSVYEWIHTGILERAVTWKTELGMEFKIRPDIWLPRPDQERDLVLDLKTDKDPSPEDFGGTSSFSSVRKYHHALQGFHYCLGAELLTGRPCDYGEIVVGKDEPHDVYIYDLTDFLVIGQSQWITAVERILGGVETAWRRPDQGKVIRLSPTQWDLQKE